MNGEEEMFEVVKVVEEKGADWTEGGVWEDRPVLMLRANGFVD